MYKKLKVCHLIMYDVREWFRTYTYRNSVEDSTNNTSSSVKYRT